MNVKLIAYQQGKALPLPNPKFGAIRRIFNNEQIIERFNKWLLICGKAAHTRATYTFAVRQFAKSLTNKPLTAATKEDIRAFVAHMYAKGMAPRTMQVRLDALRVFFDCLQLGSQVRVSVARLVDRRKLPQHLPHVKSEEEIERIIAAARNHRDLAVLELLYASGLRVSELANLRAEDVNLRARTLTVRQGKGGNDRIALFGRKAAAALRTYLGERSTGPVVGPLTVCQHTQRGGLTCDRYGAWWGQWRELDPKTKKRVMRSIRLGDYEIPTRERAREALDAFLNGKLEKALPPPSQRDVKPGAGLTKRQIFRIVVDAARRAGVTGVHPHTLRHSMATHCLDRGMDIRHVQELLGHTSLIATQKYLHLSTTQLKRVHNKFFPKGRKKR
jgi:site-specific recombinase XerD